MLVVLGIQIDSYSQVTMEATIAASNPIHATEATGIILLLGQSDFPAGMRAALARAINAKVSGVKVNKSKTKAELTQRLPLPLILCIVIAAMASWYASKKFHDLEEGRNQNKNMTLVATVDR